jgi:poly-gamma-glutamate capsule biosynthesis protein CapA/YwtB (metallophosphatase superfamily)
MGRGRHRAVAGGRRLLVAVAFTGSTALVAGGAVVWALSDVGQGADREAATPTVSSSSGVPASSPFEPEPKLEPPPPRRFTIAATGDILIHSAVWERAAAYAEGSAHAFDFRPMFAKVAPLLRSADLAVCHIETPVSADDTALSSFPVFSVPHEIVDAIRWAGYDTCSTSSNHSLDQGPDGIAATLDALDRAGLEHAGTARTRAESRRTTILDVNGVRVAHLSYSYGFNGFQPPADQPWVANLIDPEAIVTDARRARVRGAEFVIVSLHWGSQYVVPPTAEQLAVGRQVLEAKAVDLILGHHAHVVQPIDRIRGEYVAYGLGNLLSNMTTSCTGCTAGVQDGVVAHFTVVERDRRFVVERVSYTPTWVEQGSTWRILPVARALDARGTPESLRSLLEASWTRTVEAITLLQADARFSVVPERSPRDPIGA